MKSIFKNQFFTFIFLAMLALVPLIPFLSTRQFSWSHEQYRYLFLIELFRDAVSNGLIYPRWLPQLYGGFGYPTFIYYPPGFFYASLPISFITDSLAARAYGTCYLLCLVGTTGIYKLSCQFCSRKYAFFPTLMYLLTPYLFCSLYVRGSWAEMGMMLIVPWPLYFMMALTGRGCQTPKSIFVNVAGLAISTAGSILMHPLALIALFPTMVFIAACLFFCMARPDRFRFCKYMALGLGGGLLLSCPYWFVFQLMAPYVQLDKAVQIGYQADLHCLWPEQLFSPFWGNGGSTYLKRQDTMSFQLGLPHFILAVLGAWRGRKDVRLRIIFTLYLLILLALPYWAFFIWKFPLLNQIQFPWRFLTVIGCLQAVLIAGLSRNGSILPNQFVWKQRIVSFCALSGFLGICVFWYMPMFRNCPNPAQISDIQLNQFYHDTIDATFYSGGAAVNEFLPRTVDIDLFESIIKEPRGDNHIVEGTEPKFQPNHSDYKIACEVDNPCPRTVTINQFYFPGWCVCIDKKRIPNESLEQQLNGTGLITIEIPAGKHLLEAWYRSPKGQDLCVGVACVSVLFFLVWGVRIWFFPRCRKTSFTNSNDKNSDGPAIREMSDRFLKRHMAVCMSLSIFLGLWAATVLVGKEGVFRPPLWKHFKVADSTIKFAKVSRNYAILFYRPFLKKHSVRVVASSEQFPKEKAAYACDGCFETQWALADSSGSIQFSFPEEVFPKTILLEPRISQTEWAEDCILEGTLLINDSIAIDIGTLLKSQSLILSIPQTIKIRTITLKIERGRGFPGVAEFYLTSCWGSQNQ